MSSTNDPITTLPQALRVITDALRLIREGKFGQIALDELNALEAFADRLDGDEAGGHDPGRHPFDHDEWP